MTGISSSAEAKLIVPSSWPAAKTMPSGRQARHVTGDRRSVKRSSSESLPPPGAPGGTTNS